MTSVEGEPYVDLDRAHHVHFVGVGGIGMSALARLLLARGHDVSGSDRSSNDQTDALRKAGAAVYTGHAPSQVAGADLVVISSAVRPDNLEVVAARAEGIPVIKRSRLLAAVTARGRAVAVAGTHGKTTTSALIGHILTEAGLDPTVLIGGVSRNLGSNARVGVGNLVVVEADEYDATFLELRPSIGVITNVAPEHLDFFGSEEGVQRAFDRFACSVEETLVVCADEAGAVAAARHVSARLVTYGLEAGDWTAGDFAEGEGRMAFRIHPPTAAAMGVSTSLAGRHNALNIVAACAVCEALGVSLQSAIEAVAGFAGVERRLEPKGEAAGILVLDDYAVHPNEVRSTLAAVKARWHRPVRVIFQPHTYSRLKSFLGDFARSFGDARAVYLIDIYASRETDTLGVSARDLWTAARQEHPDFRYVGDSSAAVRAVVRDSRRGDVIVTMGAGDVTALGPQILAELSRLGDAAIGAAQVPP